MKKSFKKVVSIAAAVSMLASVASVSAFAADETATEESWKRLDKAATSVADFQIEDETGYVDYVLVPSTVTEIGNQAFLTSEAIEKFVVLEGLKVEKGNETAIEEYIAKVIQFSEKTEGWTEEELATVGEWFEKNLNIVGLSSEDENLTFGDAIVALVKEYNKGADSKLDMSEKSAANFGIWAATLTYGDMTVVAPLGSAALEYAKAREALGLNSLILGDIDKSGDINVRDAATIARNLATKVANPVYADYNYDEDVNVRDAATIARDLADGKIKR